MARKGEKNWVRIFDVSTPTRHKKGFTIYKVTSKLFPKNFPEGVTTISVWKRYNDFKHLYKELQIIHKQLHLSGEFPKFPKAKVFGRFDYDIIEERRKAAWSLLDFAAKHSQLFTHRTFVRFFETGYKIKEGKDTTNSSAGASRSNNNGDSGHSSMNGQCLVPEKVWSPDAPDHHSEAASKNGDEADDGDGDHLSISSLESSSAETATFTTDSDSVLSTSVFSDTSNQILHTPTRTSSNLIHPSHTIDFGLLSCGISSENVNPSIIHPSAKASLSGSAGYRSEVDIPSNSNSNTKSSSKPGDKDSYLDDSYTEAETRSPSSFSHVSSSKSCPSLDDINGMFTSTTSISSNTQNHEEQVQSKENRKAKHPSKTLSWSLSLRRKPNGFGGFFDFLPIFPKKAEEKKVSDEKLLADSLNESYICEAAGHFATAQQLESNGEISQALDSYKEGIRILLNGGQSDRDHKRRIIVRSKVEKYLTKAEALHSSLHEKSSSSNLPTPALFSPKKVQGLLPNTSSSVKKEYMKPSPIEDLRNYKVVGVASAGVVVAVNIGEAGPKCYAIKVLRKSASPLNPDNTTIIASQVPFMVKLIKWFDSENTIILLLQYAGGGRLEDFILTYQTKQIAIIPHEISPCDSYGDDVVDETKERDRKVDDSSTEERHNAMSVLAAFVEQLENNRMDLNGNLNEKKQNPEELCESYARLFNSESDSEEDQSCQSKQNSTNPTSERAICVGGQNNVSQEKHDGEKEQEGTSSWKVRKLAVDSSNINGDVNEAVASELNCSMSTSIAATTTTTTNGHENRTCTKKSNVKGSSLFPSDVENNSAISLSWSNLDSVDTTDLIESSKVLIQTVSRTLTQCEISTPSSSSILDIDGRGGESESLQNLKDLRLQETKQQQQHEGTRTKKKQKNKNTSSSSIEYDSDNRGTKLGGYSTGDDNNAVSNSISNRNRASTSSSFLSKSVDYSSSSTSLSNGKQKQMETNETENNNNTGWSQNQNESSLMSSERDRVSESKSQFIKLPLNQKRASLKKTPNLSSTSCIDENENEEEDGDDDDDNNDKKGRDTLQQLVNDCSPFKFKTEMSTDELLVKENSPEDDDDDYHHQQEREERVKVHKGEESTTEMPSNSHYVQPFPSHGESNNETLESYESLPVQRMVPECIIKMWAAEMVLALQKLHSIGITYGDLGMRNILLGDSGHILLSFRSQFSDVDFVPECRSVWIAPEARNSFPCEFSRGNIHFSADWWSLGAILYYLLTGKTVESAHPEGFHSNTVLKILDHNLCGDDISNHAKSLLTELLQINPNLRLGFYGADEIKSHPFFDGFDWESAIKSSSNS